VRKAAENDPAGSAEEDVQADDHAPPFWDYRAPLELRRVSDASITLGGRRESGKRG
jgi:hypothetical protein